MTYAANREALRNKAFTEIEFVFPKAQAVPLARKILAGATKHGHMLVLECVYAETPDAIEENRLSKIKFLSATDNASPLATLLISAVQDNFDTRKPVIPVITI